MAPGDTTVGSRPGSRSGAVEPTRCRRRIGAGDRLLRLGDYERREPHGTLDTGRADVRAAIVEAFKVLPDIDYQLVRMLHDQEGL